MSSIEPDRLAGCQRCQHRIKSQEEAAHLLKHVIRQAHMRAIKGGGTLLEVHLDPETVVKMCVWEVECEDCEMHEEFGDATEPDSQYDNQR